MTVPSAAERRLDAADGGSRSSTTAEIETFISDVSNTNTNIAIASSSASRLSNFDLFVGRSCAHH